MKKLNATLFPIICAVICTLSFLGCSPAQKENDVVRVGYRPTVTVDLAFFKALEEGVFKNQGLEIELKPYGRPDLILSALKSGQIDASLGVPLEMLISEAQKGNYSSLMYLVWYFSADTPYDGLVVLDKSEIKTISQLEGKVIGSHPSRQVTYFVETMYPKSKKVRAYNPATPYIALKSKDVDAVYVLEPFLTIAKKDPSLRVLESGAISSRLFDEKTVPAAASVVSAIWQEKHPDVAQKFMRIAMEQFLKTDTAPDQSLSWRINLLGMPKYGGRDSYLASHVYEPVGSTIKDIDTAALQSFLEKLSEVGLVTGVVDFEKMTPEL